jgi:hypothetical protein
MKKFEKSLKNVIKNNLINKSNNIFKINKIKKPNGR